MSPDRSTTFNGKKVEEFYWAGDYVVYVDNQLTKGSYDRIVARLTAGETVTPEPLFNQGAA